MISNIGSSRDAMLPLAKRILGRARNMSRRGKVYFIPKMFFEPMNIIQAISDIGSLYEILKQRDRRFNTVDDELGESAAQTHQAVVARLAVTR